MPQQICPNCHMNNPWENRYCGNCGRSLTRYALVPSRPNLPVPAQNRWLGLAQAPLVQAATVSLGALIFRSAFAWLRRRRTQRSFTNWPAALEKPPSGVMITRAQQDFSPHRSGPMRVITLAWWSVRVVGPAPSFKDELEYPE